MSLLNCVRCGKLITQNRTTEDLCVDCYKTQEEEFDLFRDYLRQHPAATLAQVAEHTGLPLTRLTNWIRNGRIHI